jgi:hypothetical protein
MTRRAEAFQTIHSAGGLLPADLLRRLLEPKEKVPGIQPEDYGLAPGERLNEVLTQSWNRLRRHWAAFREAAKNLADGQPGDTLTNDRWNLPLLRELGFGVLPFHPGQDLNGRLYPIHYQSGPTPIHLIGCGRSLDRRASGVQGNPHGLVQEFLNRSPDHVWALVTNGLRLRVLRDSQALSRQSYLEFDLEALFAGEVYADFVVLWLVVHATRFAPREAGKPESCWLEQWTKLANEQGARALGDLRQGVERALQTLGQGLVGHPRNTALREALRDGTLALNDLHGQLLRVVYRLIFLFVAEDRTLDGVSVLHPRRSSEVASSEIASSEIASSNETAVSHYSLLTTRYSLYYSTARLRQLAGAIKGSRHGDLWQQFNLLVGALSGEDRFAAAREALALPALGSGLWNPASTADLNAASVTGATGAELSNADFLEALRQLAFTRQGKVLRPVDYKNLGAEELGGVYESLLALTPRIEGGGARFTFAEFAGNERKTSGSYYTPDALVQCLLDSALDPVVEARLEEARRLANREIANRGRELYVHQLVSRSESLAGRNATSTGMLSGHQGISEGRVIRHDVTDSTGSSVDSSQYRGGLGAGRNTGVYSLSSDSTGQPQRTGDPFDPIPTNQFDRSRPSKTAIGSVDRNRKDDSFPDWFFTAQAGDLGSSELGSSELGSSELGNGETPNFLPSNSLSRYSLLAEQAILNIRVCDPAVGSGHFLVGAAHRLARHLARVRAQAEGESEPSPLRYQSALREVIGRCLYGVDLNPMAAELCRVNLWLEALEPGKPLSFLDHHIRVGNSLLGATPALIAQGIPDEAFKPIAGDDPAFCREYKKQNQKERKSRMSDMFGHGDAPWERMGNLATAMAELEALEDDTVAGIQAKQARYEELVREAGYLHGQLLADAWCAAFVWKKCKEPNRPYPILDDLLRKIEQNPYHCPPWLREEIGRLAAQYQFFHGHLAFPEVFARGGFDVVLGNPPWERVKLQEKEWFAERSPEIANAPNAAARKRLIEGLKAGDPALYQQFQEDLRQAEGESHFLRNSRRYPLCGRGDINVYTVFAEGMRDQLNATGRMGCVLPSGIATDDTTKFYFQDVVERKSLASLFDFENKNIFPSVHSSYKFCLFTAGNGERPTAEAAEFVFFAHDVADLRDPERRFSLSPQDIALLNPNTRTCPIFRSRCDAELTKMIYRRVPVLIKEGPPEVNPWGIRFSTMFHMSNDSHLFRTREQLEAEGWRLVGNVFERDDERYLPLYEAKMLHHFDHRWATYERNGDTHDTTLAEKQQADFTVLPRYWVPEIDVETALKGKWGQKWLIGWRDICRSTDERTVIGYLGRYSACPGEFLLAFPSVDAAVIAALLADWNSFPHDFIARQKVGGTHLKFFTKRQIPVLPPTTYTQPCPWSNGQTFRDWLLPHVLELTYTAWDLEPFARDCVAGIANSEIANREESLGAYIRQFVPKGADPTSLPPYSLPPFQWNEARRFLLRCELDAAFFHLYLGEIGNSEIASSENPTSLLANPYSLVSYIMDTFPIVKRKDEAAYGSYRTKDTILEIYDAMTEAMATGQPYPTRLDPPAGDVRCCHPAR